VVHVSEACVSTGLISNLYISILVLKTAFTYVCILKEFLTCTSNYKISHSRRGQTSQSVSKYKVTSHSFIMHSKYSTFTARAVKLPLEPRGWVQIQLYSFFDLGVNWGWLVNATSPVFLPKGNTPVANCTGGWMGPRTPTDGRRKFRPRRDLILEPSSPYQIAILTALSRLSLREL
jgi:hypothetical protein